MSLFPYWSQKPSSEWISGACHHPDQRYYDSSGALRCSHCSIEWQRQREAFATGVFASFICAAAILLCLAALDVVARLR